MADLDLKALVLSAIAVSALLPTICIQRRSIQVLKSQESRQTQKAEKTLPAEAWRLPEGQNTSGKPGSFLLRKGDA